MEDLKKVLSPESYESLVGLDLSVRIEKLKEIAFSTEVGPELTTIQNALVELISEERPALVAPLESARDFSITENYDVLMTDIDENDFKKLSVELGVERLSQAESNGAFPTQGVVYGRNSRMFVPLVLSKRMTRLNVLFLYDTGSPSTYIRKDTMEALGYTETIPEETDVFINGVRTTVRLSRGHFETVISWDRILWRRLRQM